MELSDLPTLLFKINERKIWGFVVSSNPAFSPDKILSEAAGMLRQRGAEYDGKGYQGGERSMAQTVVIFEAITGIRISELDGWRFLIALKLARSTTGKPKLDTYVDLAGYAGLAGECALSHLSQTTLGDKTP